jgi:uncharacterized protein
VLAQNWPASRGVRRSGPGTSLGAVSDDSALGRRVRAIEWNAVRAELEARGFARIECLLDPAQRRALIAAYAGGTFRSTVVMARHGYGSGEYRYFDHPLPGDVATLRSLAYEELVPVANRWSEAMALETRYPLTHREYVERCHAAGQTRPTPLILRYGPGDYNCLHQDLYGEHVFPLQLTILLSDPAHDFSGGEFVLTEQRPRMQSRVEVVPLGAGDAVLFAVRRRPVQGARGVSRVNTRHGVSRVRTGERYALGVIFHDAS